MPGAAEVLAHLQAWSFRLVVISNQSGIGRGLVTPQEAQRVHNRVLACLAEQGVRLDGAYYCPHDPAAGCSCRKPLPGLLHQAASELSIDLARSFMIGDKASDIAAGRGAGCRTIFLGARPDPTMLQPPADAVAGQWADVLEYIQRIVES
jgi:histidinol-phosphate phosphatase family protein